MKFHEQPVNPTNPNTIPKFVDELVKPPVAKAKAQKNYPSGSYYELTMLKAKHRFHGNFPYSDVWGYDGIIPSPTIEEKNDHTIYVKYLNKLPQKHFLPIDLSLHGANNSPEVRTVVHLHGANVASASDWICQYRRFLKCCFAANLFRLYIAIFSIDYRKFNGRLLLRLDYTRAFLSYWCNRNHILQGKSSKA